MLACVVLGGDGVSLQHPRRVRNTCKPVSRLSEQTGLPSRQTGLQADLPGLGFDLHPNPSPSPNKPVGTGASPFCKPKKFGGRVIRKCNCKLESGVNDWKRGPENGHEKDPGREGTHEKTRQKKG
ncbi:hypothetical protein DFH09DRAFT_1087117 [Mycena vulgaris]|nr:hypothetical protein DFH09DRAFT_1087117 [Mycena vulgaris]